MLLALDWFGTINLRQKLLSTFGGLAVLALLNAGVTGWAIASWQKSNRELTNHYQRCLLVKELTMGVLDVSHTIRVAISAGEPNTHTRFKQDLATVEQYFEDWSQLAHNEAEKKQIRQLKNAYLVLLDDSEKIFQLLAEGRTFEALQLRREKLNNTSFPKFKELSARAINNDNDTGIKQSLLERVFNSKEITENNYHRSPMGLKLTKAIVEQHGGELVFESNSGKGTRVQINLPILKAIAISS